MDEDFIIELWDTFKDYVPEKNKNDAASHFVDFLVGHDVSNALLGDLQGYDPYLDRAIDLVLEDVDNDEEEDEDYTDYDDEE